MAHDYDKAKPRQAVVHFWATPMVAQKKHARGTGT